MIAFVSHQYIFIEKYSNIVDKICNNIYKNVNIIYHAVI